MKLVAFIVVLTLCGCSSEEKQYPEEDEGIDPFGGTSMTVRYGHGWTKGWEMNLDAGSSIITFLDYDTGERKESTAINPKDTIEYVYVLLGRVVGVGERKGNGSILEITSDGAWYDITIKNEEAEETKRIGSLRPPGRILVNEGYSFLEELEHAESFRQNLDYFLLAECIDGLADIHFRKRHLYFPHEKSEPVGVRQRHYGSASMSRSSSPICGRK